MNRGELRWRTRELAGVAETAATTDPADLNAHLNAAYREVLGMHDWPFLNVTGTITTANGTDEYAVPAGSGGETIRDVTGLAITSPDSAKRALRPRQGVAFDEWRTTWTDEPREYALVDATTIRLRPTPDGIYTIRVRGVQQVADLSADSDTPVWKSAHHELLAFAAAGRVLRRRREEGAQALADSAEADARSALDAMRRDYLGDHDNSLIVMGGRRSNRIYPPMRHRIGY